MQGDFIVKIPYLQTVNIEHIHLSIIFSLSLSSLFQTVFDGYFLSSNNNNGNRFGPIYSPWNPCKVGALHMFQVGTW
jgi:hypothetical protein